jgi:tRNA(Ile)-lysidine synthase
MKKKSLNAKKKANNLTLKHLQNPKIKKIYKIFESNLSINNNFSVAVSGGPDSMALAFLAKCFSIINNVNINFYLVDHKLRKESSQEAKVVISVLKKFNIKCELLRWNGKKPTSNIQGIARKKRYYLLSKQCIKDKTNNLLLGHHLGDLYENFLIRLLRGSGLKGLTSFGQKSEYNRNGVVLLRPLIGCEKKELIYISNKVFNFFIKDPSNSNENFKRIKVRNLLSDLEKEGLDKKKFNLTIDNLKDSDKSINFYVKNNLDKNSKFIKDKNIYFLNKDFFKQPNEIILRSINLVMRSVSKHYYPARGKSVINLIRKIQDEQISSKTTLGGCFIEKVSETILISKEND